MQKSRAFLEQKQEIRGFNGFREVAFFLMKKAQRGSYSWYSNPISAVIRCCLRAGLSPWLALRAFMIKRCWSCKAPRSYLSRGRRLRRACWWLRVEKLLPSARWAKLRFRQGPPFRTLPGKSSCPVSSTRTRISASMATRPSPIRKMRTNRADRCSRRCAHWTLSIRRIRISAWPTQAALRPPTSCPAAAM